MAAAHDVDASLQAPLDAPLTGPFESPVQIAMKATASSSPGRSHAVALWVGLSDVAFLPRATPAPRSVDVGFRRRLCCELVISGEAARAVCREA